MPKSLDAHFSEWQLGEIQTSSKGVNSASLTADGQPIYVQLTSQSDPLSTPFGAITFNNEASTRLSIDFRCTPELQSFLERVDSWACGYLADNSERLFKGKVPEYRPCLSKRGDYTPTLRCKINTTGQRVCRFWNDKYEKITMPEDLKTCGLVPRVQVKSLYIMGREVGLVIDCTDLLVITPEESCPFVDSPFE